MHALIAALYLALAVSVGLRFSLDTPRETAIARLGAALFFTGCGLTHVGLVAHSLSGEAPPFTAWHHVLPAAMQVVGALAFGVVTVPYVPRIRRALRNGR